MLSHIVALMLGGLIVVSIASLLPFASHWFMYGFFRAIGQKIVGPVGEVFCNGLYGFTRRWPTTELFTPQKGFEFRRRVDRLWYKLPDDCEVPSCKREGNRGNENIINELVMCDDCMLALGVNPRAYSGTHNEDPNEA